MAYTSGMLRKRVTIAQKMTPAAGKFGRNSGSGGARYTKLGTYWGAVDFARGTKQLREGVVDAYDTIMVRMRYNENIDRDCLVAYNGRCYNIQSLNVDYQDNMVQITCTELPDKSTDFYNLLAMAANGAIVTADGVA